MSLVRAQQGGTREISGHWRRGTVNGHLAYVHIQKHTRTAKPAPPTKKEGQLYDPKKHSALPNCALPKPGVALKMAQQQQRPKPKVITNAPIDVD